MGLILRISLSVKVREKVGFSDFKAYSILMNQNCLDSLPKMPVSLRGFNMVSKVSLAFDGYMCPQSEEVSCIVLQELRWGVLLSPWYRVYFL